MVAETSARPLLGRNAAVTGGARGIGRAIAMELGRQGANLIITYRREEHLASAVASDIRALGASCTSVHVDVRNQEDLEALFEEGRQRYGKIDILVNNAGVTEDGLVMRMSDDSWDRVMETNLRGAFLATRLALRQMTRARWGRIINITSRLRRHGQRRTGQLRRRQGGHDRLHARRRPRGRLAARHGQRRRARLRADGP